MGKRRIESYSNSESGKSKVTVHIPTFYFFCLTGLLKQSDQAKFSSKIFNNGY